MLWGFAKRSGPREQEFGWGKGPGLFLEQEDVNRPSQDAGLVELCCLEERGRTCIDEVSQPAPKALVGEACWLQKSVRGFILRSIAIESFPAWVSINLLCADSNRTYHHHRCHHQDVTACSHPICVGRCAKSSDDAVTRQWWLGRHVSPRI